MTSATYSRRRTRLAAAAAGLAAALVVTGCSGGDGGGTGEDTGTSAPAGSPTGSGDSSGDAGESPSASAAGALEGSWVTTRDGKAVALVVTGDRAALFSTGGSVCSGTAKEESGTRTIELKCTDGDTGRARGTVGSVGSTDLKVEWEGLGAETYTKAEGGKLPSGLPTAGPGS